MLYQSTQPAVANSTSASVRKGPAWKTVVRMHSVGLEQAVDRLHQRVVVGVADGPDRGGDALKVEVLGVPDRGVLRSRIAVMD